MNCDECKDLIPAFIKKELEGEKRIHTKSHLKTCVDCRKEYLSHEKIFYTLDREEILIPDPQISRGFKTDILYRINQSPDIKRQINKKWIWYTAATTLLIGMVIGHFIIPDTPNQNNFYNKEKDTLSQLIASENWNRLEIVLSDRDEFNRFSSDRIPIHILLDKLSALQKMGIQSLPMVSHKDQVNSKDMIVTQIEPHIQISLNDFIHLLEQAKLQRSQITLREVSNILTKL